MDLVTPPRAKVGDKAYVISPSAGLLPFVEKRVARAKKHLEALGFEVIVAPNAAKNSGYISASAAERVADIHMAFEDTACTLIIAAIGGNHSNQLLSKLNFDLIAKNPKIFVGYSDNTVLHLALATKAKLQSYYGPCFLNQFGEYPGVLEYTTSHFMAAIFEDQKPKDVLPSSKYTDEVLDWFKNDDETRPRRLVKNDGYTWWKDGKAEGWALPFTIPSVNHLLGSTYLPDCSNAILFIDIPEGNTMHEGLSVSNFDSFLTDLDTAGILKKCTGIVIGRPYKYTIEMKEEVKTVVLRICDKYDYPILFNVDFGHTDPMITLPYGSHVKLDSALDQLRIG